MPKRSGGLLLGIFLLIYLIGLGARPLIIPDEVRYAEIPREMLASGDWLVPRLNGLRYFEKPPLGYWLNALSFRLFGQNNFGLRFPTALAVGITALALFYCLRRFLQNDFAAFATTGIYLTSALIFGIGTFATLDSMVSAFMSLAFLAFFGAYRAPSQKKRTIWLIGFGLACGLAFLTKGFITLVLPLLVIGPFLIWERKLLPWLKLLWLPAIPILAIALPWSIAIFIKEPDYWPYFVWFEHFNRFFSGKGQHPQPFWFFLPNLLWCALPWTIFWPAAWQGLKKKDLADSLTRYAILWFLGPFIFFSASGGKLITYILPCFVPLAILTAKGLTAYLESGQRTSFKYGLLFLLSLIVFLIGAGGVVHQISLPDLPIFQKQEIGKLLTVIMSLVFWSVFLCLALKTQNPKKALTFFIIGPVALYCLMPFVIPDRVSERKAPGGFLQSQSPRLKPQSLLVADNSLAHAVCWFYKRSDVYLLVDPGEFKYGLDYPEARPRWLRSVIELKGLLAQNKGRRNGVLILQKSRWSQYRRFLPAPSYTHSQGHFIFLEYQ